MRNIVEIEFVANNEATLLRVESERAVLKLMRQCEGFGWGSTAFSLVCNKRYVGVYDVATLFVEPVVTLDAVDEVINEARAVELLCNYGVKEIEFR